MNPYDYKYPKPAVVGLNRRIAELEGYIATMRKNEDWAAKEIKRLHESYGALLLAQDAENKRLIALTEADAAEIGSYTNRTGLRWENRRLEEKLEEYLTHHEVHHIDCEIASFEALKALEEKTDDARTN